MIEIPDALTPDELETLKEVKLMHGERPFGKISEKGGDVAGIYKIISRRESKTKWRRSEN